MASGILSTTLGRFRVVSFAEGISFLLLLGVAMPLKYVWKIPEATMVAGSIHGGLFIAYLVLLFMAKSECKWSFLNLVALFFASIFPFGFLLAEYIFLKKQAQKIAA